MSEKGNNTPILTAPADPLLVQALNNGLVA
jgi:hypothetical protein